MVEAIIESLAAEGAGSSSSSGNSPAGTDSPWQQQRQRQEQTNFVQEVTEKLSPYQLGVQEAQEGEERMPCLSGWFIMSPEEYRVCHNEWQCSTVPRLISLSLIGERLSVDIHCDGL